MSDVGAAAAPKKAREYSGGANALCVRPLAWGPTRWVAEQTTSQCAEARLECTYYCKTTSISPVCCLQIWLSVLNCCGTCITSGVRRKSARPHRARAACAKLGLP